ncbi:cysteine-rich VLP protein [Clostridium formicaceticum]|uniref:cysteine-rich VLP protein n=1 Tax=Clostridium formicaceticum TaxID=1497 RepID=UPI0009D9AD03|nr:cysteine-rich VLP protein [Clostridium formicaceticum]
MDKKFKKEITSLIKRECANYDSQFCGINHYCCMVDTTCIFFRENQEVGRCKYFEKGVLPLEDDLESGYRIYHSKDQGSTTSSKPAKPRIKCERCGTYVKANSNRQRYCDSCKKHSDKEKARLRKQKSRSETQNVTI